MRGPIWCRGLITEPGAHARPQAELADALQQSLQDLPDPDGTRRMVGFVYARSGIARRHVEASGEQAHGRADWLGMVNQCTTRLAHRTLERLAAQLPEGLSSVDALVVVSTSFVGFPSLSRQLQQPLGIPLGAACFDLTGLGCAGPTQGIFFAWTLLQQGYANVCLLFVDTMATWGLCRQWSAVPRVPEIVAHCLASDGAAALLLSTERGDRPTFGLRACRLDTQLWPDSLDQNDLTASDDGQPYLSVGKQIRTRMLRETAPVFTDDLLSHEVVLHPGGPDLMRRLAEAHPSLTDSIDRSLSVLQEHGNLGSASVLFVMEEALRRGALLAPRFHMFALGPGIVTTVLRIDGVEVP